MQSLNHRATSRLYDIPAMAVEELLSVVGLPARQGLLSALDRPNRPQGPT